MSELTDRLKALATWTHEKGGSKSDLEQKIKYFKDLYYNASEEQKQTMEREWDELGL